MAPNGAFGKKGPSKDNGSDSSEPAVFHALMLREAAEFAPIPYLKIAAGTTLKIVNTVQAVKHNKADFQRLAQEATEIIAIVWWSYRQAGDPATWSQDNAELVEELATTLGIILAFVEEQVLANCVVRYICNVIDGPKIKKYRERLQVAVSDFKCASHLMIQDAPFRLLKDQQCFPVRHGNQAKPILPVEQPHVDEEKTKTEAQEEAEQAERQMISDLERMEMDQDATLEELLEGSDSTERLYNPPPPPPVGFVYLRWRSQTLFRSSCTYPTFSSRSRLRPARGSPIRAEEALVMTTDSFSSVGGIFAPSCSSDIHHSSLTLPDLRPRAHQTPT